MKPLSEIKIVISSDHAGYELKDKIIAYLKSKKVGEIKDYGAFSTESSDYPDFAHPMASAVSKGEYDFGISCCGTGNGINMASNRHSFVRSALCWTAEIAKLAREHNNANALSLPARFITEQEAYDIIDAFFSTDYEGGRHERRVEKIERF
ncbi:ribose 5-phosphate isomerase B [Paludibacter sp. 221]|uniref:ribose 5-phosphate isomerase B n=1 Tax=Paludibacter sp. 221 TaxID=2302939 RepID=UPI0013D660B8|nr:ribose 5-phosphate isomerase B [Paludibacter sp. 221]NDV47814.1 ribose 5-phosphate isomerase B [Paludibacter sp. 221]